MALNRLTRRQIGELMALRSGIKGIPAKVVDRVAERTDGVPLFVEELTRSILESGDLREAGDRWEYAGRAGTLAIPLTLRDSLMARLDRVAVSKEIAQVGSVIGREFSYELIAGLELMVEDALGVTANPRIAFCCGRNVMSAC